MKRTIFISIGDEPDFEDGFNSLQDLVRKAKPDGLEFEFRQFKGENHGSVVLPAYYAGLRKVFEGWEPPPIRSVDDLERHYAQLSKRFGYKIDVPEDKMNLAGYLLLRAKRIVEAIAVFRKNAATYPASANVFDSLADAYEENGQLRQAAENYEKAASLAEASGDTRLAAISRGKLEKVRARLK